MFVFVGSTKASKRPAKATPDTLSIGEDNHYDNDNHDTAMSSDEDHNAEAFKPLRKTPAVSIIKHLLQTDRLTLKYFLRQQERMRNNPYVMNDQANFGPQVHTDMMMADSPMPSSNPR